MSSATAVATDSIRVAKGIDLSVDYVTKVAAILAQRRKGKTYCASVIAEELVRLGQPWVALDPTGAWWGLRSSADGERAGLPVVVIGGQHGDLPLDVDSGAAIADLVLDHPGWYVLDLSLLEGRPAERTFATDFGTRLHRRKMQPGMDFPFHLFIDEADMFVPQEKETKSDVPLLAAYQGIVRRGGLHGLGVTLISQRPALVNKSVLTQLDLLILLRLVAGNDQDAVFKNYLSRAATKAEAAGVMGALATLKVGEAWFFEPGTEPRLLERAFVRQRETFNSSATPKIGETRIEPKVLADVMLDDLRVRLADAVERAAADDPEILRRRVEQERRLRQEAEGDLRDLLEWVGEVERADDGPTAIDALIATYQVAKSRVGYSCDLIDEARALAAGGGATPQRVSDADALASLKLLAEAETAVMRGLDLLRDARDPIRAASDEDVVEEVALTAPPERSQPTVLERTSASIDRAERSAAGIMADANRRQAEREQASAADPVYPEPTIPLPAAARAILGAIADHHPLRLSHGQVAMISGRKARGGSWNSAVKALREGGYVDDDGSTFALTEKAIRETGASADPLSPSAMRDRWRAALPTAAKDLYDLLDSVYPRSMTIALLADRTGRQPRGGSWNSAVATLTRNGLARRDGDSLVLTAEGHGDT